jgi:hypothetical protein
VAKVTLNIDEELIRKARAYSERHGMTISQLVSRFLKRLPDPDQEFSPIVQRLHGILPSSVDVEEYRAHLEEKHGR